MKKEENNKPEIRCSKCGEIVNGGYSLDENGNIVCATCYFLEKENLECES